MLQALFHRALARVRIQHDVLSFFTVPLCSALRRHQAVALREGCLTDSLTCMTDCQSAMVPYAAYGMHANTGTHAG